MQAPGPGQFAVAHHGLPHRCFVLLVLPLLLFRLERWPPGRSGLANPLQSSCLNCCCLLREASSTLRHTCYSPRAYQTCLYEGLPDCLLLHTAVSTWRGWRCAYLSLSRAFTSLSRVLGSWCSVHVERMNELHRDLQLLKAFHIWRTICFSKFPGSITMFLRGSERLSDLSGITQQVRSMITALVCLYHGPQGNAE